ncbi:MAG: hypothetical protein CL785_00420 [Chloroflexi bacterium]|nr:hypothetical protein [Chloroflexota bacterium]
MVGGLPSVSISAEGGFPITLIISVKLVSGEISRHTYAIPPSQDEVQELIARTIARIDDAFNPETPHGFVLENPVVIYNLQNVMAISVEGLSEQQLHAIAEGAEKTLGFNKNKNS